MIKLTWSLKSKTKACPRAFGGLCVANETAMNKVVEILEAQPLANNGKYQINRALVTANEGEIEIPTSGPAQLTEYTSVIRIEGTTDVIYFNLPGLSEPITDAAGILLAVRKLVDDGDILSASGHAIGTVKGVIFSNFAYSVKKGANE